MRSIKQTVHALQEQRRCRRAKLPWVELEAEAAHQGCSAADIFFDRAGRPVPGLTVISNAAPARDADLAAVTQEPPRPPGESRPMTCGAGKRDQPADMTEFPGPVGQIGRRPRTRDCGVMAAPAALAGGSFVLLAVIVVLLVAVVWGYYTKTGSDITPRPSDGLGGDHEAAAPGAEGHGRIAGKVDGEQDRFDTHGTQ